MKKRFLGLIALTMCLMFVTMPAAMASFYVFDDYNYPQNFDPGFLIEGGTQIYSDSSGMDSLLEYVFHNGNPSKFVSVPDGTFAKIDGSTGTFWHSFSDYYSEGYEHYEMQLEYAGSPVMTYPFYPEEGCRVFVFDHPLTGWDMNSPADAENAFIEWVNDLPDSVKESNPNLTMKMYDAAVYVSDVDGLWRELEYIPGDDFYLPSVPGKPLYVLHYTSWGGVEYRYFDETDQGLLIHALQECSPFAIVYNADPVPPAPPSSGDNSPLVLLSVLAGLSLAGIVLLTSRRRKAA